MFVVTDYEPLSWVNTTNDSVLYFESYSMKSLNFKRISNSIPATQESTRPRRTPLDRSRKSGSHDNLRTLGQEGSQPELNRNGSKKFVQGRNLIKEKYDNSEG